MELTLEKQRAMPIRSYVLRIGRITPSQKRALEQLESRYMIDITQMPFDTIIDRQRPIVLEIGFGMGESLVKMAQLEPQTQFIGVEVHLPGVGQCMAECERLGIDNLKVISTDVYEVIGHWLPSEVLDRVQIFFPDPWPKARHTKRRLINPAFLDAILPKLKANGLIYMATDWADYAAGMLEHGDNACGLTNQFGKGCFAPDATHRIETKFERRGKKLSHQIFDLIYQKRENR